jgi:hypothetical protein
MEYDFAWRTSSPMKAQASDPAFLVTDILHLRGRGRRRNLDAGFRRLLNREISLLHALRRERGGPERRGSSFTAARNGFHKQVSAFFVLNGSSSTPLRGRSRPVARAISIFSRKLSVASARLRS